MENIGIIDIGSNSVRLVLVKLGKDGSFKIIDELKESVRLGECLTSKSYIDKIYMDKAIQTLKVFSRLCSIYNTKEIIAVATEAVRKADNSKDFIKRAKEEASINVRVLSGTEEAYYDYLGVIYSLDVNNCMIIDIGGSSTEIILVDNRQLKESISLPFGAINLSRRFNLSNPLTEETENTLFSYIKEQLASIPWIKNFTLETIIGVGGTIRNLGKISRRNRSYPLDTTHNYEVQREEVNKIYNMLKIKTTEERKKIKGLSKDRADIIPGPCAVVNYIMDLNDISTLKISGNGIREGIIYEYLLKQGTVIDSILDYSINNILINNNTDKRHADCVYNYARLLFQHINEVMAIGDNLDPVLKAAALLHDIGTSVNYYNHQKHSFYIILNSRIDGLSHKEILMTALTAASHRSEEFTSGILQYSELLSKEDIKAVQKLGVILEMAEGLYKVLNDTLKDIQCYMKKDTFIIKTISEFKSKLEFNIIMKSSPSFKKIFKNELLIL